MSTRKKGFGAAAVGAGVDPSPHHLCAAEAIIGRPSRAASSCGPVRRYNRLQRPYDVKRCAMGGGAGIDMHRGAVSRPRCSKSPLRYRPSGTRDHLTRGVRSIGTETCPRFSVAAIGSQQARKQPADASVVRQRSFPLSYRGGISVDVGYLAARGTATQLHGRAHRASFNRLVARGPATGVHEIDWPGSGIRCINRPFGRS